MYNENIYKSEIHKEKEELLPTFYHAFPGFFLISADISLPIPLNLVVLGRNNTLDQSLTLFRNGACQRRWRGGGAGGSWGSTEWGVGKGVEEAV